VTTRSKARVFGRSLAEIAGPYPAGGIYVCLECRVFSGRGLYIGLITRPEGITDCGVYVCDSEASDNEDTPSH
jgi:hypothetical protein